MGDSNVYVAAAVDFLQDIGVMLNVVIGRQEALLVKADNIVSTEIAISRPETLIPLFIGMLAAFVWTQLIELVGSMIAKAIGLKRRKLESFTSAWCEAVYFSVQIFVSYRMFSHFQWFWPSGWDMSMEDGRKGIVAKGLEGVPPFHTTRDMRAYYVCEFGYYFAMLIVIFLKTRKKDFWEMVFHHAVTSALISLSYCHWHLRIGVIVMMLHNAFDPWLNIAKCAHYAFKGPLHIIADVSFAIGAVVFLVSRLIMYPYAIYFAWTYAAPAGEHPLWGATGEEWTLKLLLCFLYPIHVFWFGLILKVAKKALLSGAVQKDERSDSEDEDEDSPKKTQ